MILKGENYFNFLVYKIGRVISFYYFCFCKQDYKPGSMMKNNFNIQLLCFLQRCC